MPRKISRSGASCCSVAAAIAASGGVRSWSAITPVPRPSAGAATDTAPSRENASLPLASATQSESYPSRSASRAVAIVVGAPSACSGAVVAP